MQKNTFSDGGFVLHKITGDFKGRVSAWFDKEGNVLAAEQYPSFNSSRPVKKDGPIWNKLERIGQIYK